MIQLSIKKRSDFLAINKENVRFYSKTVLLLSKSTPEKYLISPKDGKINDFCRVGYTNTKKIGNAVVRNKIKRRYREAFSLFYQKYAKNHYDYVLIGRNDAKNADFTTICRDLEFCFKGLKKLEKSQKADKIESKIDKNTKN